MKRILSIGLAAFWGAGSLSLAERISATPREVVEVQKSSRSVRIPPIKYGYGLAHDVKTYHLTFEDGSKSNVRYAENALTGEIPNKLIPKKGDKYLVGNLFGYNFGRG